MGQPFLEILQMRKKQGGMLLGGRVEGALMWITGEIERKPLYYSMPVICPHQWRQPAKGGILVLCACGYLYFPWVKGHEGRL